MVILAKGENITSRLFSDVTKSFRMLDLTVSRVSIIFHLVNNENFYFQFYSFIFVFWSLYTFSSLTDLVAMRTPAGLQVLRKVSLPDTGKAETGTQLS